MDCPKCYSAMAPVQFGTDINVMRCTGCFGLYCERSVLESLRDEWLADTVLDTGSAAVGGRHNEIRDIPCPGCGHTMVRTHDSEQEHIALDLCPSCDGVFLDAGELTDMKNLTLMDMVRKLLAIFDK